MMIRKLIIRCLILYSFGISCLVVYLFYNTSTKPHYEMQTIPGDVGTTNIDKSKGGYNGTLSITKGPSNKSDIFSWADLQPSRNSSAASAGQGKSVPRAQVYIHARYRTGSTFASEFFNQNQEFLYIFEPCSISPKAFLKVQSQGLTTEKVLSRFKREPLERFLRCDINSDLIFETYSATWKRFLFCQIPKPHFAKKTVPKERFLRLLRKYV